MISLLEQTLCYVAEEQFESLAFLFPLPEDPNGPTSARWATVSVGFAGPFGGRLVLAVPPEMLGVLASNMVAADGRTPPPRQQIEAVKELIHVVCDNLLPAIAGSDAVFDIDEPQWLGASAAPQVPAAPPAAAATRVAFDEGVAQLWLFTDRPVGELNLPDGEALAWVPRLASQQG